MGLDMYLNVRHAIKAESEDNPEIRERYTQIVNLLGKKIKRVEWKGITWRKAYSINDWFALHVSENDDFIVPRSLIEKLRDDCHQISTNLQIGAELIPKSDEEDNIEYQESIKFTLDELNKLLEETNEYYDFFFSRSY